VDDKTKLNATTGQNQTNLTFFMQSNNRAKIAFAAAIALLVLSSCAVSLLVSRFSDNERSVSHAHEVQDALRNANSAMSKVARSRLAYVATGQETFAQAFEAGRPDVFLSLERVKTLTLDNPKQQELCSHLREMTEQRIGISVHSIDVRRNSPNDATAQESITKALVPLVYDSAATTQQMYEEEQRLLNLRLTASNHLFRKARTVLIFTFALALILFAAHYQLISIELKARKEAEEALRIQNRELISANKELDAFSYSISHDLRGPLRSVDGFAHALLEDWNKTLHPQAQAYLHEIRRSAATMAKMIEDLLGLARVTRAQLIRQKVNLGELAKEIASGLQQSEPERDVRFVTPSDIIVEGDPGLLRIAMENLLRNSWKFTSKRDQANIEVGTQANGTELAYYVRDNGAGFDMRQADRLFTPFQRLHLADDFPGTGIGLATVERVIRRHGGTIWAESAPDEGATFYFDLKTSPLVLEIITHVN
jgi:signal transduction histidine kinase